MPQGRLFISGYATNPTDNPYGWIQLERDVLTSAQLIVDLGDLTIVKRRIKHPDDMLASELDELCAELGDINSAFEGGFVSTYAQQHIFNAASCP